MATHIQSSTSLQILPSELTAEFLIHLPINSSLLTVGLSSKLTFAPFIFHSLAFARRHFRHQFAVSGCPSIWEFLDAHNIKREGWLSLPFNYQTAIYGEILSAEDWAGIKEAGDDWDKNLMWSLRWDLPSHRAFKIMGVLLMNGLNPSLRGNRALRWACRSGHSEVVELLMQRVVEEDDAVDLHATIHNAVELGHIDVVRRLLGDPRVDAGGSNNCAIQLAARKGHAEIVELLLSVPTVDPCSNDNFAICVASESGHTDVVKVLLKCGRVDPTIENNFPICVAAQNGHCGVVEALLLDGRADPAAENNGAIGAASVQGHPDVVDILLKDPRVDPSVGRNCPVRWAAQFGKVEVVRRLMEDERIDPSDCENYALRAAIEGGHLEVVECLLQHPKVDPNILERLAMIRLADESIRSDVASILNR
ncbi:hypothetical protein HDU79_009540 [Rhizoclosmatium sp. JEL0117]|nr:hypothetical protein HDU79_009540 [Rhizoclosmatium sp. JEL0117]